MTRGLNYRISAFLAFLFGASVSAFAQERPWDVITDLETGLSCDIVHTDTLELVVAFDPVTGLDTFVIVTGFDDRIVETEILANNEVHFFGQSAGRIIFANDVDGFPAAWWVGFDDAVFSFDRITRELFTTSALPSEFPFLTCDGCDLWDILSDCVPACGDGICDPGENVDNCCEDCGCSFCESCVGGVCLSDCGDGICDPACEDLSSCPTDCEIIVDDPILNPPSPPIIFNICGANAALAMSMTLIGLVGTGLTRRHQQAGLPGRFAADGGDVGE